MLKNVLIRVIWIYTFLFPAILFAESIKNEDIYILTEGVVENGWWSVHTESGRRVNIKNSKLQNLLSEALVELDEIPRPWSFEKLFTAFDKEKNIDKKILILTVLASTRDPRSAILLKKIYDSNEMYDQEVEKIAFECLRSFFIIPNSYSEGTHQKQIEEWWQQNEKSYREAEKKNSSEGPEGQH